MKKWGIRKTANGYEVYGRMIQHAAKCLNQGDATVILIALVARYEGIEIPYGEVKIDRPESIV
jgi:hypothetical protein